LSASVRPRFFDDVAEEVTYLTGQAGEALARRWAEAVWATVAELTANPGLGRARSDLPFPGIRSWRVVGFGKWLVFYGQRDEDLVFYRVRHGAMNLGRLDFGS
jgi:plasmid stabilization system protein ParE